MRSLCSHLISRSASGAGPQIPMIYFFKLLRFHDENINTHNRFLCQEQSIFEYPCIYEKVYMAIFCGMQGKKKRFLFKNMIILSIKVHKTSKTFIYTLIFIHIDFSILNYIIVSCRIN